MLSIVRAQGSEADILATRARVHQNYLGFKVEPDFAVPANAGLQSPAMPSRMSIWRFEGLRSFDDETAPQRERSPAI
jgi:hypothetical protein